MKKYKIDNYIVTANSLHDAVSIVRQIKDAYSNGIILEKHETYKGPNGQFTVVKVRRDNGRIQYVVTSDKRDIDAGDKMPSGTIENDLASAIKTAKEYANARKRNSDAAHDSIKDGKYVSELKPGDIITKKDGSKWDVVLVRHTPFGIQVRMNSKTSPVKTEEITYRPTDMLVYDSVKDSTGSDIVSEVKRAYPGVGVSQVAKNRLANNGKNYRSTELTFDFNKISDKFESADRMFSYIERKYSDEVQTFKKSNKTYVVTIFENLKKDSLQKDSLTVRDVIQSLINEETSAISSYNVALETLKDHIPDEAYKAIKAIRDDEQRHVENLYAVLNGNVTPKNLEN